jgi:hypothetical protein
MVPAKSRFKSGEISGIPFVKFTLTYDGELPSSGNGSKKVREKWEIRKQFDPQLRELWKVSPGLRLARTHSIIPAAGGFWMIDTHHSDPHVVSNTVMKEGDIDLCAHIERGGRKFFPLVRESFALMCGLKILFLRKEKPGRVYQGGDLDDRIKTLLDALCIPDAAQVKAEDATIEDPIHCLLEDDSRIMSLDVQTERLLSNVGSSESEVRLVVEVDVRVTQMHIYNAQFLGD